MKKKLLCLFLCFAMLLSFSACLTSCSNSSSDDDAEGTETESEADRSTMTLSMYVVTEIKAEYTAEELAALSDSDRAKAEVVMAAYQAVEDEINKMTKSKFKTQLDIHFLTEDEYYETVETAIKATEEEAELKEAAAKALKKYIKEQKQAGNTDTEAVKSQFYAQNPQYARFEETTVAEGEEDTTTADETVLNEYGVAELKYPDISANQVDILWIGGTDNYTRFVENEWLSQLNEELTGSSKKLKDFIYPEFLDAANSLTDGTYAIPNNTVMGEYTYLLLDKELLEKYYYDAATITTLADIEGFLADIAAYEKDVIPFAGKGEVYNVHYWTIDPDTYAYDPSQFQIVGCVYTTGATLGTNMSFSNLLRTEAYINQLLILKKFEEAGYFVENYKDTDRYAATVVKGGAELEAVYGDDYRMVVLENPMASENDIFGSMYAVGAYTANVSRSMEIVTYLNTNSDFRNLLQYGIKDVNYRINENGALVRENQNYMMDLYKTGNIFIAYPEENMSVDAWTWATKQNLAAGVYPTVGFSFDKADPVDEDLIRVIAEYSAEVEKEIAACKTYDELVELFKGYDTEYKATVVTMKSSSVSNKIKYLWRMIRQDDVEVTVNGTKLTIQSPYMYYYSWLEDHGFIEHV